MDDELSGTIFRVDGERFRDRPTSLMLRARSEDEQGWVIDIHFCNEPVQCVVSGYFFEHALRSFSKGLRSLQWNLGGEATLLSFEEQSELIVVRGHHGSANVHVKLVHCAESKADVPKQSCLERMRLHVIADANLGWFSSHALSQRTAGIR